MRTCLSSSHIPTQFEIDVIADLDLKVMRKFYALLSREVRSYFHSPIAYIVLIFFLLISGVDFYFQISFMNQRQVQYTVQEAFFNSVFFWFAFVLIFPLITMRLFAEEFKLGTIEPLMTAPVRDWQVVLSKFFGALIFYLILWVPPAFYFIIFQQITGQAAAHSACSTSRSVASRLFSPETRLLPRSFLSARLRYCSFSGWFNSSFWMLAPRRATCSATSPQSSIWERSRAASSIRGRSFST